jgi:hypothetical protein
MKRRFVWSAIVSVLLVVQAVAERAEAGLDVRDPGVLTVGGTTPFSVSATLPGNSLLVLDVDADILGSPLDSVVSVTGPTGTAENDNDPFTFDSSLGVMTSAGSYTIQITDKLNRSGPSFFFLAKVLLLPLQPSGGSVATGAGANFLTVAGTLTSSPWMTQVSLSANTVLTLDVDAQELGSPLDSVLEVVGPGGAVIASNDDDLRTFDSALAVRIPDTGTYTIRITDFQQRTGANLFFLLKGSVVPGL